MAVLLACDQVLKSLFDPYQTRLDGTAGDSREYVPMADLAFRLVYTLVVVAGRSGGDDSWKVEPSPGMGSMLATIRLGADSLSAGDPKLAQRVRHLAEGTVRLVDAFNVQPQYPNFKSLRDSLSHGHALSADALVAERLRAALASLSDGLFRMLMETLDGATLDANRGSVTLAVPGCKSLALWPLWGPGRAAGDIGVYSHADSETVFLIVPGREIESISDSGSISLFQSTMLKRRSNDKTFSRFVSDLVRDIASFTETYSAPSYYIGDEDDAGTVVFPWQRATSDGAQSRIDRFRIGPNHERQWAATPDGDWRPYSLFLKEVANTGVIAKRIGSALEAAVRDRAQEERQRLGFPADSGAMVPQRLLYVDPELQLTAPEGKPFELEEAVDRAVEALRPNTKVFFVVGQAGLGKTRLLLNAALQRAQAIEADPGLDKPLYLFVSSSGRALSSLEDAVNSALNVTRLLSSHSAKTLCRNGQLVLLVDGFDELLGVAGYENALGSLEPWFRDLGGRGVLVASARSSYYLSQYRRSLSEAVGFNVDHTLAEIQQWTRTESEGYLSARGVPAPVRARLTQRDWELLGIPFLAKAFVAWHLDSTKPSGQAPASIFDIVVDTYLRRESGKLEDPNRGELMSASELRACFTVLAEQMQREDTRQLDMQWLELAAEYAIGSSPESRPGLRRRLSSLCALGATYDEKDGNRFQFSHEIMFDCFLSLALEEVVTRRDLAGVELLLKKGKVHSAALGWLTTRIPGGVRDVVDGLMRAATLPMPLNLQENLGALWESALAGAGGVPPFSPLRGVRIGSLELAATGWTSLTVERCHIERLTLRSGTAGRIAVTESEIGLLVAPSTHAAGAITSLASTRVRALDVGDEYADSPSQVRKLLVQLRLAPPDLLDVSPLRDAAEFYLDRLTARSDIPVVTLDASRLADDDRLRWTSRLGPDLWRRFLTLVERSELATWERITAGGAAKSRLVFEVSPAAILRHDSDPRVTEFWEQVAPG